MKLSYSHLQTTNRNDTSKKTRDLAFTNSPRHLYVPARMKHSILLGTFALVSLSSSLAHANTAICTAKSEQLNSPNDPSSGTFSTHYDLKVVSREAGVLESVELTTTITEPDDAASGLKPLVGRYSAKYLKPGTKQKDLLRGWIHATAYLIEGKGCFGSVFRLILPNNLHRLAKGTRFKTEIGDEKAPLLCVVRDPS